MIFEDYEYAKCCLPAHNKGKLHMKRYDVLAIGELNVDLIMTGLSRMPEIGREITGSSCSLVLGSSTAICASGLARLGMNVGFIGKIGKDLFGEVVLEALKKNRIDTSHVITESAISTGITVSLSFQGDRALVTCPGSIEELSFEDIDLDVLNETRHIHVGSYFLQTKLRPGLSRLFRAAWERGVTTSLDAGWDDTGVWNYQIGDVLSYTDFFFPNETEALHITGCSTVKDAATALAKMTKAVIVKCGPDGALAQFGNTQVVSETFNHLKPLDTTGAGDSFNAGFLYGHLQHFSIETSLLYGNACGSISVTQIGGASSCPSLEEVEALIQGGKVDS